MTSLLPLLISTLLYSPLIKAAKHTAIPGIERCCYDRNESAVEDNQFLVLSDWFNSSVDILPGEIAGFYRGRCHLSNLPNTPFNTLLGILRIEKRDRDYGRAFPSEKFQYVYGVFGASNEPENYYDSTPTDEISKHLLEKYDWSVVGSPLGINDRRTSCGVSRKQPKTCTHFRVGVKNSQHYVLSSVKMIESGQYNWGQYSFYFDKGEIVQMCYYW